MSYKIIIPLYFIVMVPMVVLGVTCLHLKTYIRLLIPKTSPKILYQGIDIQLIRNR